MFVPSVQGVVDELRVDPQGDQLEGTEASEESERYIGHVDTLGVMKGKCYVTATGALGTSFQAGIDPPDDPPGRVVVAPVQVLDVDGEIEVLYPGQW